MRQLRKARSGFGALAVLWLWSVALAAQNQPAPITLALDAREAPRGILRAQLTIPVQPGPLTLLYPKWIPGEHGPSGPISDLVGLKMRADGQEIPWRRNPLEMYAFHCEVPAGIHSLEVSFAFLLPTETSGFTAGASSSDNLAVISWNQVLLYPQGRRASEWSYAASLRLPPGWQFATALPTSRRDDAAIEFQPVSLETLVDSPVIAGRYFQEISLGDADGRPHSIAIVAEDEGSLEMSPETEAALRRLVAEAGALFGARHYRRYTFLLTLSDYVAHFGLEHHESSDNRRSGNTLRSSRAAASLGALLPHEFVHSWNGKYRRPAGLATANFDQPMDTSMLWMYEGLTTYLGYVLAARSGLWTDADFRSRLAQRAAALERTVGRTWRPLEDTAVAAQILYFARRGWSDWRRRTDFYDEAALIWLEADILMRQRSQGRYSLDDFCRRFFGGASDGPRVLPYAFEDVVATLTELVPYDWRAFFTERLTSTSTAAPLGGITASGWRLTYRSPDGYRGMAESDPDNTTRLLSLGMSLASDGEIQEMTPGGPADQAGLAPGMQVASVNGRKYAPEEIRQAIQDARSGSGSVELIVQSRGVYRTVRLNSQDGERFPELERDGSHPDLLSEILRPLAR